MTVANQLKRLAGGVLVMLGGVDWEGAWPKCGYNQTIKRAHVKSDLDLLSNVKEARFNQKVPPAPPFH